MFTDRSDLQRDTRYFHTDGLGSVTIVTDEKGQVLKRYAYDAWGKQSTLFTASGVTNPAPTSRGFTDHEMLSDLGLVHMNGRVYDPVLGRFISADPHVDDARDAQGYNRYSYVANNPLGATDPTGYFKLKDALKIVAVVAAGIISGGAALAAATNVGLWSGITSFATASFGVGVPGLINAAVAGAGAGFGSGFTGSLLNGGSLGDAFRAGALGALVGGVGGALTFGVGNISGDLGYLGTAGAHGVVQGGLNEAAGGEFRHGFYSGFFSSAAANPISAMIGGGTPGQTIAAAIVGGTASAVGGGKFANGAIGGALQYLFNHAAHLARSMGAPMTYAEARSSAESSKRAIKTNAMTGEYRTRQKFSASLARLVGAEVSLSSDRRLTVNEIYAIGGEVTLTREVSKRLFDGVSDFGLSTGVARGGAVSASLDLDFKTYRWKLTPWTTLNVPYVVPTEYTLGWGLGYGFTVKASDLSASREIFEKKF